ncbi:OmpA family protein [Hymenobacter sp. BT175]|uniref:OmpA family protein n=1 Tax=Hymenobacter translucens TaxID=2886507 RepID=UPI001D0EE1E4|nr:OmpA family protein [Hymenobacter translucens]MCC2546093.1 OmpA family protein [Hymenobacter translucens]
MVTSTEAEALAGAQVTVVHLPSGSQRTAAANSNGSFEVANLSVGGPYMLKIEQTGYRPQIVNDVFLTADKTTSFSFSLIRATDGAAKRRGGKVAAAPTSAVTPVTTVGKSTVKAAPQPVLTASAVPAPATQSEATPISDPKAEAAPILPASPQPSAPAVGKVFVRQPVVVDAPVNGHYDAVSGNYIYETGQPVTLMMSGGVIEKVGINSTESKLYQFLTDPQMRVDSINRTKGWINFDRVFFETGKATLTKESMGQLRNIACLMRTFPKAKIRLGGYTDTTGTFSSNMILSEARAQTALAVLVDLGIDPSRLQAKGYGPRYPIVPSITAAGRAQNRRLSVRVISK